MKRSLFFIAIIVLIILTVFLIGYFFQYRADEGTVPPPTEEEDIFRRQFPSGGTSTATSSASSSAPIVSKGSEFLASRSRTFGAVSDYAVAAYYPENESSVVLIQPGGQVLRVTGANSTVLSSVAISGLREAAFSYDGKKLLVIFGTEESPQVSIFDVQEKSWAPLFIYPTSPVRFAPRDYRLVYVVQSEGKSSVELVNTGLKNPRAETLFSFSQAALSLSWRDDNRLLVSEKSTAYAPGMVFSLDIKNKTIAPLLTDARGANLLWNTTSPTGGGLLFTAKTGGRGGAVDLLNKDGQAERRLVFLTLPQEKCYFPKVAATQATSTGVPEVLCALPRQTSLTLWNSAPLPDAYYQGKLQSEDYFVRINLQDGSFSEFLEFQAAGVNAESLQLSGETLFFVNSYDKRLYALEAKKE